MEQAEQQVVLPDPVDAEIAPRQSLATNAKGVCAEIMLKKRITLFDEIRCLGVAAIGLL